MYSTNHFYFEASPPPPPPVIDVPRISYQPVAEWIQCSAFRLAEKSKAARMRFLWSLLSIIRPNRLRNTCIIKVINIQNIISKTEILFYKKMAVFWVVAPCSLHQGDDRPDDGGSKDLWNFGKLLPDYTALQPRRQPSSYSPPSEPQILSSSIVLESFAKLMKKFPLFCEPVGPFPFSQRLATGSYPEPYKFSPHISPV
jgi:hypothetical protein